MNRVFGVFRWIGHEIGQLPHLIAVLGHDVDVIFIDLLKGALAMGFTQDHIYHAVEQAKTALETYVEGKEASWTATTVATLQHEFVASSLVEKFGLQPALSHTLTSIVSRLFQTGSSKLDGLIDAAVAHGEAAAGLKASTTE